jgi:cytochrome c biogenesis protein CcmG, thiol:disulfide interchange protein DsbE
VTAAPQDANRKQTRLVLALAIAAIGIIGFGIYSVLVAWRTAELDAREKSSIGTVMPEFSMPVLQQLGKSTPNNVGKRELLGKPYLLHAWASWCVSCREEHPAIRAFAARKRIRLIGYNVDDEPELALRWLARYGDPYEFSLVQATQQTPGTIPLTTTPQLILVDGQGVVRWRQIGTSAEDFLVNDLLPEIERVEREK